MFCTLSVTIVLEYISSCILTPKSVWLKLPLKKETPLPPCRQLQNNLYLNSMKTSQEMKTRENANTLKKCFFLKLNSDLANYTINLIELLKI